MKSKIFSFILLCFLVAVPSLTLAAEINFISLVGIPGIDDSTVLKEGFGNYINALYRLSISIAALLAVIKIVAAGAKYMLSDIVTSKEEAKKDIQGALVGLLIVIGAVIILNTVNTDITKNSIAIDPVTIDSTARTEEALRALGERLSAATKALCSNLPAGKACQVDTWLESKEDCENNKNGQFIDGNALKWYSGYGGGKLRNVCTYIIDVNPTDVVIDITGNDAADEAACLTQNAGNIWDNVNKKCSTTSGVIKTQDVPSGYVNMGLDLDSSEQSNINELSAFCQQSYGSGWNFDTTTKKCTSSS